MAKQTLAQAQARIIELNTQIELLKTELATRLAAPVRRTADPAKYPINDGTELFLKAKEIMQGAKPQQILQKLGVSNLNELVVNGAYPSVEELLARLK